MSERRFPPPWTVETIPGGLKVCDAMASRSRMSIRARTRMTPHMAKVLTTATMVRPRYHMGVDAFQSDDGGDVNLGQS